MVEKHPQVDELFAEALRRAPGPERTQYLDTAYGADVDLRQRVERLLRAAADAGSFLETPAQDLSPTVDQPTGEKPTRRIGPYELLQQIGEGGMGEVWVAKQTEPVRRSAAASPDVPIASVLPSGANTSEITTVRILVPQHQLVTKGGCVRVGIRVCK